MRRRDLLVWIALASGSATHALAGGDEKAKKKSGGDNYIPINPLTGTTRKAGGRRGVLSVDIGLQVDDAKLRTYAEQSLPRLRAAYVQMVEIYAAGLPPGSEPDADYIGKALQRQTDLILKRPGAKLLIGSVLVN